MTRNDYLELLNQSLCFLDAGTRHAAVAFYTELLDDRMEEGMSEEEAVAAMETAETIAARMRQERGEKAPASDVPEVAYTPCAISYSQADLSSLYVSFINRPVIIEPAADGALTISYTENEHQPLEYSELGGHIRLIEKEPLGKQGFSFFGRSLSNVLDALFRGSEPFDPTVRIRIPAGKKIAMDVRTRNGKISLSDLDGMGEICLRSTNGTLHAENIGSKKIDAKTSNARILLRQVYASERLTAQSTNGAIEAEQVSCHGGVELRTSNARIRALNLKGDDMLYLHTTNGALHIEHCEFPCITLKTSNGNISGALPGAAADYTIESHTTNGFNNLPGKQAGGEKVFSAHTTNSNIHITFEKA